MLCVLLIFKEIRCAEELIVGISFIINALICGAKRIWTAQCAESLWIWRVLIISRKKIIRLWDWWRIKRLMNRLLNRIDKSCRMFKIRIIILMFMCLWCWRRWWVIRVLIDNLWLIMTSCDRRKEWSFLWLSLYWFK